MSTKRKAEPHSRTVNRPRIMKSGGSRVDSERDSGFSDASSEHMSVVDTTDSEDSPRPAVKKGLKASGSGQPSQLTVVGGSYSNLSPMIIMNNVLLKQQPGDSPPALKPWGFSPAVEVVQPVVQQPQVVFLQPVVSRQSSKASKDVSSRHRRPKSYLPILKSYPKIAPHPGDSSSSSGRGTSSSSSSSASSSSSGSEKGSSQPSQKDKHQKSSGGTSSFSSSAPVVPSSPSPVPHSRPSLHSAEAGGGGGGGGGAPVREKPSPNVGQPESTGSLSLSPACVAKSGSLPAPQGGAQEDAQPDLGESSADIKRKRFCNTYNILSKSGLLDIALRTKELHRQNRRTQTDLDQLKEHTDLFLHALYSGDSSICIKLQTRLQEEGGDRERDAQAGSKADTS